MNKQAGSSTLIILLVLGVIIGGIGIMLISSFNQCQRFENRLETFDQDIQNVHTSVFGQMKQLGLSYEKYGKLVIEAIQVANQGRYGKTGSGAAMQWIQEQNPTIDPRAKDKLESVIEAGYNRFEAVQRSKLEVVNSYKDAVDVFPNNIVAGIFGFPSRPWSEMGKIVVSSTARDDFARGELTEPEIFTK